MKLNTDEADDVPFAFVLSEEEHRLLAELLTGRSDQRVAFHLDTSDRTVRRRVSDLMRRFGAPNRFTLGVMLGQLGLVRIGRHRPDSRAA
ncbi:LuxR C-terminal-related transcriptional regulator [Phytohabitans aurantiacus]|jgi:DNA-binding NarL/FixJ family response regulator|uniref:HTH luxR-type domain-containing protein n=1 Tax=Phytohabitans aurantiacus TaxID=3016789 RepID=A0ABQ5QU08_9ACTN|nr:LuxR C-terminal-related transcriptional regulator [Phytohabitans aurantiacus]GLH97199.1 hypothetical protein Pa4123_24740 [Phytohabitans aurantiacus]